MSNVFTGSIQLRRGSAFQLSAENRILLSGELAFETDTLKSKLGDGVTRYNLLAYTAAATGGAGATAFSGLSDKASVDLPSVNAPLAAALAAKPTSYIGLSDKLTVDLPNLNGPLFAALASKATSFASLPDRGTADLPATNAPLAAALAAKPTSYSGLSDKLTVDLPNTNTPLSQALSTKAPYKQVVGFSTVIPLDTDGNGKYMLAQTWTGGLAFSVGAGPVEQGNCNFCLVGDGANTPNLSAFVNVNSYSYVSTAGTSNVYGIVYAYGTAFLYGQTGTTVPFFLQMETGSYVLLESGSKLIL